MKIFIYTSDFLGAKPIIELCEYTFQYGARDTKKPSILVEQSDPEFCKVPSKNDPFIFIFDQISKDKVKDRLAVMLEEYRQNKRMYIFVITKIHNPGKDNIPEFTYLDLGFKHAVNGFNASHFFVVNKKYFEENFSKALRNVISRFDL